MTLRVLSKVAVEFAYPAAEVYLVILEFYCSYNCCLVAENSMTLSSPGMAGTDT